MSLVRPPALAATFYPQDPLTLMHAVDAQLQQAQALAQAQLEPQSSCPKILIAPHAGHVYSGLAASIAYARIAPHVARIGRIVMLCPAHREYFIGVATPDVQAFATPLGTLEVDALGIELASQLPFVQPNGKAHEYEHALEVHLPFLQRLWQNFAPHACPSLVPLVVGDIDAQQVAQLIDRLWGQAQTLILVSTDLSHFQSYESAQRTDGETCAKVRQGHTDINHVQACGATPLNAALMHANARRMRIEHLVYCNSGDTAGNTPEGRERVVGYASFALYEPSPDSLAEGSGSLTPNLDSVANHANADHSLRTDTNPNAAQPQTLAPPQGAALVQLARAALHYGAGAPAMPTPLNEPWLDRPGACFVTLTTQQGQLRGCIGSLQATRSIKDDVIHNAQAAALHDPRFAPVTAEQAPSLHVEVSVLTAPRALTFTSEAHALWQLWPLVDGVIFSALVHGQMHQSTFLPQVWEQIPTAQMFMAQLKLKAGLPADFWSDTVQLQIYRVQKFTEGTPANRDSHA